MNIATGRIKRKFEAEAFERAARKSNTELTVFLAGPFIETNKRRPRKNKRNAATLLRYDLYNSIDELGYDVTLGEYKELIAAHGEALGALNNAANAEIGHAEDHADAVVMLPSSPGSFTEFGAFSLYETICKKMLIIVDKQYEHASNYFNTGPKIMASNRGAVIEYVNYEDTGSCSEVVEGFLMNQLHKKIEKGYLPK